MTTPKLNQLDAFTCAYIEAIIFTECHPDNPELDGKDLDDFAPETLARIVKDCQEFQTRYASLLADAYGYKDDLDAAAQNTLPDYDEAQAGHDFWLTRNGYGAGFWDRGLGEIGDDLTRLCGFRTAFPEISVYAGDDGKLYLQ